MTHKVPQQPAIHFFASFVSNITTHTSKAFACLIRRIFCKTNMPQIRKHRFTLPTTTAEQSIRKSSKKRSENFTNKKHLAII